MSFYRILLQWEKSIVLSALRTFCSGMEVSRLKPCVFDESWSLKEDLNWFESIVEASLDTISNEGCYLISEILDEEGKRCREEEILVEMIFYFSKVTSCLEEEEESLWRVKIVCLSLKSEEDSSVTKSLEVTFFSMWFLKILLLQSPDCLH